MVSTPDSRITALEVLVSEIVTEEVKKIAVLESQIADLRAQLSDRLEAQKQATALALTAADQTTAIAQDTADKAVARAEAAASKEHLESQIEALRQSVITQIIAQKEAISAALIAAKDALTAALAASEKAIQKAEASTEARFAGVNAFRAQLGDQAKTFLAKTEGDLRFGALDKQLDEVTIWRREVDLKFSNYVTVANNSLMVAEWTIWRRIVDAALTAAQSRTGLMAAMAAMAIAVLTLLIAIFNMFSKAAG